MKTNIIFSSKLSLCCLGKQAFEAADDIAAVKINLAKKEVELDTDLTVEEICEIIDNTGYTFPGLEFI